MSKKSEPTNLSEAIDRLENAGQNKFNDLKQNFEGEYQEIRRILDELQPHLKNLKGKIENETYQAKNQVEAKVKENPWLTLGAVGVVAFILGWIFGSHKKD